MSAVLRNEACRKVFLKARESLDQKMDSAFRSMIGYSKHSESDSLGELGFGSCLLLALISALSNSELMLSAALLELSASYSPLKSSHFTAWLVEDYTIDVRVIEKALEQLFRIDRSGLFCVPGHMRKLLVDLAQQSGICTDSFPSFQGDMEAGTEGNAEAGGINTEENVGANRTPAEENSQEDHVGDSAANEGACSNARADHFPSTESPAETDVKTMVINSVITDNCTALEELAARGADLSITADDRQSLLHMAAKRGCINTAKSLIQLGARLNRKDSQRLTPLHKAIEAYNLPMIQLLIQAGANTSCKLLGGETMLMFAIVNSSFSAASLLLNHGMHINDKNYSEDTALHIVLKEYKNTAQSLTLEQRKLTSSRIRNIVKFITDHDGDINITNASGGTALHIAAGIADKEVVESLVAAGAVVGVLNNIGETPLHIATSCNNYTILEKLVSSSCSNITIKDNSGKSPLHLAVSCGSIDCLEILLESGGNLDMENNSGYTPLCIAAEIGHTTIVEMLCKKNVKINHKVKDSRKTPLHLAAEKGHTDIVEVLLDEGAEVQAKARGCTIDSYRRALSPLHYAAMGGHLSIVQSLIERGADLEAKDNRECTPLHFAAGEGHLSSVQELVASGSNLEAKHKGGSTPLQWASGNRKHDVASFLRTKMR